MAEALLSIRDLDVAFETARGLVHAVRGVTLELRAGETLAVVGESGSGKSAFARALLRLNQPPFTLPHTLIGGSVELRAGTEAISLLDAPDRRLAKVRANHIAMIGQESLSGLNPVWRIGTQIREALRAATPGVGRHKAYATTVEILAAVGLPQPEAMALRYPHQLSGGQRQRVMIAMAIIRGPRILIADEPTTALDVTVQARILRLMVKLRADHQMAMIFISHDLAVVAQIADRIAVMYGGSIVELGPVRQVLSSPRHPYTAFLLRMQPENRTRGVAQADRPRTTLDLRDTSQGCPFRARCDRAVADCARLPDWDGTAVAGHRCLRPIA